MRHPDLNLEKVTLTEFAKYFKDNYGVPESTWEFLRKASVDQVHALASFEIEAYLKELKKSHTEIPKIFLDNYLIEYFALSDELQQFIKIVGGTWFIHGGALRAFLNFFIHGVKEIPEDVDLFVIVDQENLDNQIGKISFGNLEKITERLYVFKSKDKPKGKFKDKPNEISCLPDENRKNLPVNEICEISAESRDISINAMFMACAVEKNSGIKLWQILDPYNGIPDIKNKKLRLIGKIDLGFQEINIHQRVLKILIFFRIIMLKKTYRIIYRQEWEDFSQSDAVYIKEHSKMLVNFMDNGQLCHKLPKLLTKGYGYALLLRLEELNLLYHFFPHYEKIKNIIFSLQLSIDQLIRDKKIKLKRSQLYAMLFWPSFCQEYLLRKAAISHPNFTWVASNVLTFATQDRTQINSIPLKFTYKKTLIEKIISSWEKTNKKFGHIWIEQVIQAIQPYKKITDIPEIQLIKNLVDFIYDPSKVEKQLKKSETLIKNSLESSAKPLPNVTPTSTTEKSKRFSKTKTPKEKFPKQNFSNLPLTEKPKKRDKLFHQKQSSETEPLESFDISSETTLKIPSQPKEKKPKPPVFRFNSRFSKPPEDLYLAILNTLRNDKLLVEALNQEAKNKDEKAIKAIEAIKTSKLRRIGYGFFTPAVFDDPYFLAYRHYKSYYRPVDGIAALLISAFTLMLYRICFGQGLWNKLESNELENLAGIWLLAFSFISVLDHIIAKKVNELEHVGLMIAWCEIEMLKNTTPIKKTNIEKCEQYTRNTEYRLFRNLFSTFVALAFVFCTAYSNPIYQLFALFYFAYVVRALSNNDSVSEVLDKDNFNVLFQTRPR